MRLRGRGMQPQHGAGDDAQRALGADEELLQVIAGVVLHRLVERGDDRAVGQHHLQAEHQVARHAVADHPVAAGIGGEIAADLAAAAGAEIQAEIEPGVAGGLLRHLQGRAGPDGEGGRPRGPAPRRRTGGPATARSGRARGWRRRPARSCRPGAPRGCPACGRGRGSGRPPRWMRGRRIAGGTVFGAPLQSPARRWRRSASVETMSGPSSWKSWPARSGAFMLLHSRRAARRCQRRRSRTQLWKCRSVGE